MFLQEKDLISVQKNLQLVRSKRPLILNITNYVTMEFVANVLLSIGASPIMSLYREEMEELTILCNSVNMNLGTPDKNFEACVYDVLLFSQKNHKEIIVDPVGCGATSARLNIMQNILKKGQCGTIKGNATEILAIDRSTTLKGSGVDSSNTVEEAHNSAIRIAKKYNCIVSVTGQEDFITDGQSKISFSFGHHFMSRITGMGCALSAVISAFQTVSNSPIEGAVNGMLYFSLCGSLVNVDSPVFFQKYFMHELYKADFESMKKFLC